MNPVRLISPRRLLGAGSAAIVLSAFAATGGSAGGSITKNYVVPTGDVPFTLGGQASCTGAAVAQGENLGQVCFTVDGVTGTVDLSITDTSPVPAGGSYTFYKKGAVDPAGVLSPDPRNGIASGVICGTATGIAIPDGAYQLFVMVGVVNEDNNAPNNQDTSIACGKPSPGTKGNVTATFSGDGAQVPNGARAGSARPAAAHNVRVAGVTSNRTVSTSHFRAL